MHTVATMPQPGSTEQADPRADVFVSYSRVNQRWVDDVLVPALEAAGLKVLIDDRDFEIGVPLHVNIERAMEGSRHTVVVLTPAWLAGAWTEFESLLVAVDDPANRRRKLVPLMLEPCPPLPKRIAFLTWADFTNPARRDAEMGRLLRALTGNVAPQAILPLFNEQITQSARDGLGALGELMAVPAVRDAADGYKNRFQMAREQMGILYKYKQMHDLLHKLQFDCHVLIAQEIGRFPDDAVARANLEIHQERLQQIVQDLQEIAARAPIVADETAWIRQIDRADQELRAALEGDDPRRLRKVDFQLNTILNVQPTRINALLLQAAQNLKLPALVGVMKTVLGKVEGLGLDPEKLARLEDGVEALAVLDRGLAALASDHDRWQAIDAGLRPIEANLVLLSQADDWWPDLREKVASLCRVSVDRWSLEIEKDAQRFEAAFAKPEPNNLRGSFRSFRSGVARRFDKVDQTLKDLCSEVSKVGEPLDLVLEMIR
jgi:hypothetical protein